MALRGPLAVWLYDSCIARLSEPEYGKLRLAFLPEAERRFRAGSTVLSASMPIDARKRPNTVAVRAFFHGLLPEGDARGRLSDEFGVARGDDFGLLSAIGRDCAGAVVLQPEDDPPPGAAGRIEVLGDGELEEAVKDIRDRPLGADREMRVSLAGAQEKLLLARTKDGLWGRPVHGAPSTHILKPQDMRLDSYAKSEAFCLDIARTLGLTTVATEVIEIAGRPTIVVPRYDRKMTDAGNIRIHQEDSLQALGVDVTQVGHSKYESRGGPSLEDFASMLRRDADPSDLRALLRITTLNVVVGNADAHAKNLSILHHRDGSTALAPAYDITPTTFYRNIPTSEGLKDMSDELGMKVNGKRSIHAVTADDLATEGVSWGLIRAAEAKELVGETIEAVTEAIPVAAGMAGLPSAMVTFVSERADALSKGLPASHYEAGRSTRRSTRKAAGLRGRA